jgi:hypothetical protein
MARALQKPAKRNNPDSMIDYRFLEQDDIKNPPMILQRGDDTFQAA